MKASIHSSFGVDEVIEVDEPHVPLDEIAYDPVVGTAVSIVDIKRIVVNMCSRIFRALGPGFREQCYQKALEVELNRAHIRYLAQAPVPLYYLEEVVAVGYADIIVEGRLVLELKAAKAPVAPGHLNQCRGYMRAGNIQHGLVVNFPQYKARNASIDVYDCYLGNNYPVDPIRDLTEQEIRQADANEMGPASLFASDPIESYDTRQMNMESEDGIEGFSTSPPHILPANHTPIYMSLPPIKRRAIDSWLEDGIERPEW